MHTMAEPIKAGVTDFGEKDRDESIGQTHHEHRTNKTRESSRLAKLSPLGLITFRCQ